MEPTNTNPVIIVVTGDILAIHDDDSEEAWTPEQFVEAFPEALSGFEIRTQMQAEREEK